MPISKHRRRNKVRLKQSAPAGTASVQVIRSVDDVQNAVSDPALDFAAKVAVAGVWWYQQMLVKVGGSAENLKLSRQDQRTAALLLCVAMDGENGKNDDLSPVLADLLRPYCATRTFAEAWEQAKHLPAGSVRAKAARALGRSGRPAG